MEHKSETAPKVRARTGEEPEELERKMRVSRNFEEHELENALRSLPQHGEKMKELLLRLFNLEDPETADQRTADRWIILPIRMHHEMRDCYSHPDDVDSPVDGLLSDQLWGDRYTMFFDSRDSTMIDTGHQNEWADIELPDGSVKKCENPRGKRLLKSVKESNGYEAYRMLIQDLTPSSRSRVLALMQTIHNWPTFDAKTGVMVQLSKFESAVAIDRVSKGQDKGKDKGKGKGKGKHQNQQYPQSGKGKGKDKGKGKGKQQNQQYPQSGKGNLYKSTALCGWCQKPGHYKRECCAFQAYLRQNGQDSQGACQVQDASVASTSGSASIAASSMPSSAGQYQANAKAKVNRVAYVDLTSFSPSSQVQGRLCAVRLAGESSGSLRLLMAAQLRRQCEST
eukprot:s6917_g3.t1